MPARGDVTPARLRMTVLGDALAIARLEPGSAIPAWAMEPTALVSITRTASELSIVQRASLVPADVRAERGWRALRVEGPLAFDLVGVLASIAGPLASAGVSIVPIGTFDTDYVLVPGALLDRACEALRAVGHTVAAAG